MAKDYLDPERIDRQRKRDYKQVFGSEQGKRVLADIAKYHSVFFPLGPPFDPLSMAYNEGMRSVVMRIMDITDADPNKQRQEMTENE